MRVVSAQKAATVVRGVSDVSTEVVQAQPVMQLEPAPLWKGFVEISTDKVCQADRFDFWSEQFRGVNTVEIERAARPTFTGKCATWRLGPVLLAQFMTSPRAIVRNRRLVRLDDLDHIILRVAMEGSLQCQSGDTKFIARSGEVVMSTYANTYEDKYSTGRFVMVVLDRAAFKEFWGWSGAPQILQGTSAALLANFLMTLPASLGTMTAHERPAVAQTVREILSATLASCINPQPLKTDDARLILRLKVDQIIAANLASPRLTPLRIAEIAGVSRSTLYRAFEETGGIAQHILHRRLALVRRDLESPSQANSSIAQIAERLGLHNVASFHRTFKQHFGETPASYRASYLTGRVSQFRYKPQNSIESAPTFIQLLR